MQAFENASLIPTIPPGHANRKVRAFGREIARLRLEGYSCGAIRDLLAEAGVAVSRSTVHREARRQANDQSATVPSASRLLAESRRSGLPATRPGLDAGPAQGVQESRDVAEAFVKGFITNRLIRARMQDENRGH